MARFPMLRERAGAQASTLSGGQQKLLEIARALLLEPKLMLIDEPSIGLSPRLVQETFAILHELRAKGMSILMVEQNAKRALEISDFGVVLELGRVRMSGAARAILADPKVGQRRDDDDQTQQDQRDPDRAARQQRRQKQRPSDQAG